MLHDPSLWHPKTFGLVPAATWYIGKLEPKSSGFILGAFGMTWIKHDFGGKLAISMIWGFFFCLRMPYLEGMS